jgi:hypothetical protein
MSGGTSTSLVFPVYPVPPAVNYFVSPDGILETIPLDYYCDVTSSWYTANNTVSFVMNNFPTTLTFNIGYDTTTNYGDTLVITNPGTCTNPITTFNVLAEDCTINFNTIDTAYMTINGLINSGLDSILCVWYVIDTTGTYQTYMVNYPMIDSTGCYNFQLTVYCYNKSMNYKTIITIIYLLVSKVNYSMKPN